MEIEAKRPNWKNAYKGIIAKINHDKVPKTLNITFEDGLEKFFPLRYLVNYKNFVLPIEEDGEDGADASSGGLDETKIVRVGSRLEVKKPKWSVPYWGEVIKVKSKTLLHMKFEDGTEDKFIKFPWVVNAAELIVDDGKTPLVGKGGSSGGGSKAKYTAPDGKGFAKKTEWAKYMMGKLFFK